jgi:hypothetical protein
MKRLYICTVEFEYAVMAESESEAAWAAIEVARDVHFPGETWAREWDGQRPDDWHDDCLVYGTDEDLTLGAAIAAEEAR